jgi:ribosome-associated protein
VPLERLVEKMKDSAPLEQRIVKIKTEPTELYKILKFENMVQSGGEAKFVISESLVRVNGEIETRKRRKIVSGDLIEFAGNIFKIVVGEASDFGSTNPMLN